MSKIKDTEQKGKKSKAIKIRQLQEKDLPAVYKMIQNTIDATYEGVYSKEAVEFFKEYHNKGNILNDATTGYGVIAELNGEIVGTGTLLDDNIRRVFVDAELHNLGIGKTITRELEKQASLQKLTVIILHASLVSLKFWEAQGYAIQEENAVPVNDNQKFRYFIMTKTLSRQS